MQEEVTASFKEDRGSMDRGRIYAGGYTAQSGGAEQC
jgi:hypothetical protein